MSIRLACLGALIALLPVSVDIPALGDSSGRHETRLEGALARGQFSIVSRGCNNEILDQVRGQVRSGALAVEHEFPNDVVIGVRGGVVSEDLGRPEHSGGALPTGDRTNHYWNPHVGFEGPRFGIGVGALEAEHPFLLGEDSMLRPDVTGHIRFGDSRGHAILRFMEDVPLESDGYLSAELGASPARNLEVGVLLGLIGPYDGATIGLKGRVWLTPAAALQVRASIGSLNQYDTALGVTARLPWGGR